MHAVPVFLLLSPRSLLFDTSEVQERGLVHCCLECRGDTPALHRPQARKFTLSDYVHWAEGII